MSFKVGDIVKGVSKNGYTVTNEDSICEVTKIYCDPTLMQVKVIGKMTPEGWSTSWAGHVFDVREYLFESVLTKPEPEKKEMTIAEIEKELGYSVKVVKE